MEFTNRKCNYLVCCIEKKKYNNGVNTFYGFKCKHTQSVRLKCFFYVYTLFNYNNFVYYPESGWLCCVRLIGNVQVLLH